MEQLKKFFSQTIKLIRRGGCFLNIQKLKKAYSFTNVSELLAPGSDTSSAYHGQ